MHDQDNRLRCDHLCSTHGTFSPPNRHLNTTNQTPTDPPTSNQTKKKRSKKQHAHSAELLLPYLRGHPGRGARVLDVGAGSGYLTSVLYHLASSESAPPHHHHDNTANANTTANASQGAGAVVVVGIEHVPELTALAERNIRADGLGAAIDEQAIVLVTGDGRLGASLSFSSPLLSLSLTLMWRVAGL